MLPNDMDTLNAAMAALNSDRNDLDKIAAVGVIYLRYLVQQQIAQYTPPAPPPPQTS